MSKPPSLAEGFSSLQRIRQFGLVLAAVTLVSLCLTVSRIIGDEHQARAESTEAGSGEAESAKTDRDDDDANLQPGLIARYSAAKSSIERIDADVQFVWSTASPDARLPTGPFRAVWTGQLLVRSPGKHRLHAHVQGQVTIRISGKEVLRGESAGADWRSSEFIDLEFGPHPLEVKFDRSSETVPARLKLSWSSESFPLEPIPAQVLFHEQPRADLKLAARGEELYAHLRCNRCHQREHEAPAPLAPALSRVGEALNREWLLAHLTDRDATPSRRMPTFGLSQAEAEELIGLLSTWQPADPLNLPAPAGDRRRGEVLFRSLGCLACHTHAQGLPKAEEDETDASANEGPSHGPFTVGGDLTLVGKKRSAGWLDLWLKEPATLNPAQQMPVFALSDAERSDLAVYLAGDAPRAAGLKRMENASDRLYVAARCGACHQSGTSLDSAPRARVKPLSDAVADWSQSCLAEQPDSKSHRPAYVLSAADRTALKAYVAERARVSGSPESSFARGAALLHSKGCLNCHDRDGARGVSQLAARISQLDDGLQGQSEALIPPDLSAVGDKLHDTALVQAVSGRQPARLPWLRIRMPKFQHTDIEARELAEYLVGHDRLPEHPEMKLPLLPAESTKPNGDTAVKKPQLHPGEQLLGAQGFNCASCHRIGPLEPRNVALGTRGSDLYRLGDRMRFPFFLRWTRSPLRIVPGMEMPSYERPVAGILNGQIESQLAAMWEVLNNPQAPPAVDGSSVQQLLTVAPGASARVVRDVFRVGEVNQQWIARTLAVGLHNRQNALFDLDAATLRLWWPGDFARQRTLGKTWFWETGVAVNAPTTPAHPDIVLRGPGGEVVPPEREGVVFGHLRDYAPEGQSLKLRYRLNFRINEQLTSLEVTEFLAPSTASAASPHLTRRVQVGPLPAGYTALLLRPVERNAFVYGPESESAWQPVSLKIVLRAGGKDQALELAREATPLAAASGGPVEFRYGWTSPPPLAAPVKTPDVALKPEPITVVPGYDGVRLPLDRSIMPTAITWYKGGTLAFCSLKGQVFLARDTDGDGLEDALTVFDEGLAAPYGLIADGDDLIVAHKPELLRLRDTDGDGRADVREVVADGWGYNDNYHDWTCGIVRDTRGNLYVGLGSDYAQTDRDRATSRWRGAVLRVDPKGKVTPMGWGFRYPTGLALTPDDQLFVSDNQGVQNTFNEINHVIEGGHYGVPGLTDPPASLALNPAIRLPHPWTRSVNGLFFLPQPSNGKADDKAAHPFVGQGIGCEYDSRFLVRFSLQKVGNTYQGAVYPLSIPPTGEQPGGFQGTLSGAVSPQGDIYIGSIHDSGWLGGLNVGDIVRLRPNGNLPLGLRELRATHRGFTLDFTGPVDAQAAAKTESYSLSAYTRTWQGAYATPDSNRHTLPVLSALVSADRRRVTLTVEKLRPDYVYEVTCGAIHPEAGKPLFPTTGHYTVNVVPQD